MEQKWPQEIWLVRHGQSAGNVARDAAEAAKGLMIDIAERDVDVPLSELGVQQSQALGDWFAAMPEEAQPNVVLHSPYLRAAETARIVKQRHRPGKPDRQPGRRAPAREGVRHPRPPDHARHLAPLP